MAVIANSFVPGSNSANVTRNQELFITNVMKRERISDEEHKRNKRYDSGYEFRARGDGQKALC